MASKKNKNYLSAVPPSMQDYEKMAKHGFACKIRLTRIRYGLTRAALARLAGVSYPAVANVEAAGNYGVTTMLKIAKVLHLSLKF